MLPRAAGCAPGAECSSAVPSPRPSPGVSMRLRSPATQLERLLAIASPNGPLIILILANQTSLDCCKYDLLKTVLMHQIYGHCRCLSLLLFLGLLYGLCLRGLLRLYHLWQVAQSLCESLSDFDDLSLAVSLRAFRVFSFSSLHCASLASNRPRNSW
jgi:hypothetical protein